MPLSNPGMEIQIHNAHGRLGGTCIDRSAGGPSQLARNGQLVMVDSRATGWVALIQRCIHCGFPQTGQGRGNLRCTSGATSCTDVALVPRPVRTGHPLCSSSCSSSNNAGTKADPNPALLSSPSLGEKAHRSCNFRYC